MVRHAAGGPLHCVPCWGDYEGELPSATPPTIHTWWSSSAAQRWLQETVSLRETTFENIAGENFVAMTDPSNRHFFGVGADKVWPVSKKLTKFLAESHDQLLPEANALVVEIGAGACPLPGMWLARRRADTRVVLTDLPYLLPLMHQSVLRNFPDEEDGSVSPKTASSLSRRRPEVVALRWGCGADIVPGGGSVPLGADLAIAADIVYLSEDVPLLLETIVALKATATLIAVQHPARCCTADDFVQQASEHSLTCESVGGGYSDERVSVFMLRRRREDISGPGAGSAGAPV